MCRHCHAKTQLCISGFTRRPLTSFVASSFEGKTRTTQAVIIISLVCIQRHCCRVNGEANLRVSAIAIALLPHTGHNLLSHWTKGRDQRALREWTVGLDSPKPNCQRKPHWHCKNARDMFMGLSMSREHPSWGHDSAKCNRSCIW